MKVEPSSKLCMRTKSGLQFLIVAAVLLAGISAAIVLYSHPHNSKTGRLKTLDTAYRFRFASITQGTNHVVFSGNEAIARVKRAIYQSPLRPLVRLVPLNVRAHWYDRATPSNATVLWVGWTHRDYKVTLRDGIPQPSKADFGELDCVLFRPGGSITPLRILKHSETPFIKELVGAWEIPGHLTNLIGGNVYLRQHETQDDVAVMQLQ
jgi:hypothetical protein